MEYYHAEIITNSKNPLTYRECRLWAQRYVLACDHHGTVRIIRDLQHGGWKCRISFHF